MTQRTHVFRPMDGANDTEIRIVTHADDPIYARAFARDALYTYTNGDEWRRALVLTGPGRAGRES